MAAMSMALTKTDLSWCGPLKSLGTRESQDAVPEVFKLDCCFQQAVESRFLFGGLHQSLSYFMLCQQGDRLGSSRVRGVWGPLEPMIRNAQWDNGKLHDNDPTSIRNDQTCRKRRMAGSTSSHACPVVTVNQHRSVETYALPEHSRPEVAGSKGNAQQDAVSRTCFAPPVGNVHFCDCIHDRLSLSRRKLASQTGHPSTDSTISSRPTRLIQPF
jgi:hypothetical protein